MAQLLDFISAHKETIACFPLSVFAHMAATIRELLGPEASIVQRRRPHNSSAASVCCVYV